MNFSYISKKAKIHSSVKIGPYCVIGDNVEIGKDCVLHSHVSLSGNTKIGNSNIFYPFSSIGSAPQDLKYKGEKSFLTIGNNNTFRENVTVNPGTEGGGLYTKIRDNLREELINFKKGRVFNGDWEKIIFCQSSNEKHKFLEGKI